MLSVSNHVNVPQIKYNNFKVFYRKILSKEDWSKDFMNHLKNFFVAIYIYIETSYLLLCDRREACKESSDETESITIIFSAEINSLWWLNQVWVSIKFYYIYIYISFHHYVTLVARISLTLSRHSSLSFIALGRSSG